MFCVPPCVGCQEAGSCPNDGYRPPVRSVPVQRRRPPPRAAREAIRERGLAAYLHLACGHVSTAEEQEFYAVFRPKGKSYFCEKHGRWVKKAPKIVHPIPGLEPMF